MCMCVRAPTFCTCGRIYDIVTASTLSSSLAYILRTLVDLELLDESMLTKLQRKNLKVCVACMCMFDLLSLGNS